MTAAVTDRTVVPLNPAVAQATKEGVAAENDPDRSALAQNRSADDPVVPMLDRPAGPQAEGPGQPDSQPRDAQQPNRLEDIQVGCRDGRGFNITRIYAVQSDEYAIYQAGEGMVTSGDDPGKAQPKRKAMCTG